jgi:hypothetical protein
MSSSRMRASSAATCCLELARLLGHLRAHLAGDLEVAAQGVALVAGRHHRPDLGVPAAELAGDGLVGVHRRVGQAGLQVGVLGQQVVERVGHGGSLLGRDGAGQRAGSGHGSAPDHEHGGRAPRRSYLARLPKRCSKRATAPRFEDPFCLPCVVSRWQASRLGADVTALAVLRVVNVFRRAGDGGRLVPRGGCRPS